MSVVVNDVLNKLKGYSRNQNLTDARGVSTIDSSANFVLNHFGFPGYETQYQFNFFEDQQTYNIPADVGDIITLRYADDTLNKDGDFIYKSPEFLWKRQDTVGKGTRLYSIYYGAGAKQLMVIANNSKASVPLDSFDYGNATNWVASNDATGIIDDTILYQEGGGSLRFDINTSLSGVNRATLTKTIPSTDYSPYSNVGYFKLWVYMPTVTNISDCSFAWGSNGSNYYRATVTTQEDGSAFVVGWNAISFTWLSAVVVGSPDPTEITFFEFDLDYAAAFTSTPYFHLDYLRLVVPDTMILQYYTLFKGKTTTGTPIYNFSATTDEFLFESFDPTIAELIAIHSAIILNPQIIVDDSSVRNLYKEYYTLFVKRYPRKRANNLVADPRTTKTSWD